MEQLSFLFNEAEVCAEKKAEDKPVTAVTAHKRHMKHTYTLENLPDNVPTDSKGHLGRRKIFPTASLHLF